MENKSKLIIKLGGSLVSLKNGKIDTEYLSEFANFIKGLTHKIRSVFIVVGGGKIVRDYQNAAREVGVSNNDDLDVIGMRLTRVNAELVRGAIGRDLAGEIIYTGGELRWFSPVIVGAGWGHAVTSDYNSVVAANLLRIDTIVRLSNIDYIYSDNPKKNKKAKPFKDLKWSELKKVNKKSGNSKFRPGMNVPFDPKAVELAGKSEIQMAFIHGKKLGEVTEYLRGADFKGTLVT